MAGDLCVALRSKGVTVTTVFGAGRTRESDEDQLAFAAKQPWVLHTFNIRDCYRIHTLWTRTGREHAGLILAAQQQFSIGEQPRQILLIRAVLTDVAMRNRVEFLTNWG